ncbi:xanthine dehydrogenase family protein molybdopterin-binding subunit [Pseudonocardia eucalypti]|uniref:Xanthine dehydrogenase family protein molybdopterin-binding subunit n=1 Tax=Pseudonocardia eucalypti TaxID=648755 RepID=A0ABP9QCL2_9PSEU|nr:xanthine dehydrogenase YagR molybdenum-binding subunit [Pseudonocardia eucalypti]
MTTGLRRPDGPAKLTGAAHYVADLPTWDTLIAALVTATVPVGRLAALDAEAARQAPGVVAVLSHRDMPRLNPVASPPLGEQTLPMQDDRIHYEGQPIALVLAQTWEQARYAAALVTPRYTDLVPPVLFGQVTEEPAASGHLLSEHPDESIGDVPAGLAAAATAVTRTYTTSDRHHSPIEPAVTIASWDDDQLVLYTSTQTVTITQAAMAELFGLPTERVRVICRYIGGGFGCKGFVWPHLPLAAGAAKAIGHPVKLLLTRAQMFTLCGHQPATRQTIDLGATAEGRLTAIRHHSVNATARTDNYYVENTTDAATWLYDSPAIAVHTRVEQVDRPNPTAMRAPNEGPGMFALESAMDELAHELGIDPVEPRLRNEPSVDPMTGRPYSSRTLVECLRAGAARFGWAERGPVGSMRDGRELIGWGMASATMDTYQAPSSARVQAHPDGRIVVETGMQEIGSGLPAMVQLVASETLGCEPERVEVRHGDTELPAHTGTIGSMSTIGLGAAVRAAATEVRDKLEAIGGLDSLEDAGIPMLEAEGRWAPEDDTRAAGRSKRYSMHNYGAIFVEIRVDPDLGLIRLSRAVGRYGAGRIINPLAAHSQMTGGFIWGYGQALLERSVFEPNLGRFLSKNLAGYIVPVNADIGALDLEFVTDEDMHAGPLGAKGIGELGAVGVAPAIANAVFHATGRRIRHLPIRIHDLL